MLVFIYFPILLQMYFYLSVNLMQLVLLSGTLDISSNIELVLTVLYRDFSFRGSFHVIRLVKRAMLSLTV